MAILDVLQAVAMEVLHVSPNRDRCCRRDRSLNGAVLFGWTIKATLVDGGSDKQLFS